MKLRLNPLASDIFITLYVIASLFVRIKFENHGDVSFMNSIAIGACFVVIIWALIKLKFLNPNWFGMFNYKAN